MDIPCAPILADINVNGRIVKAAAQPTKQAYLYVFNRENGEPVWPIEERPVPQGDVPGETYSPTQPFPTKPPAFDNQGVSTDSLIDFTPELHAEAEKLVSKYKIGPLFTPPTVSKVDGPLATIVSPGALGGANWPGGSYDPDTHILYVYSRTDISALGLVPSPDAKISDMEYVQGTAGITPRAGRAMGAPAAAPAPAPEGGEPVLTIHGMPLLKPPYGRITAINLDKGEIVWQIAHGETPDAIKNNPALAGVKIPRTGSQGLVGTLTTKTLVIAGEGAISTTPSGVRGAMLRAYDKASGKDAGAIYMPAPQSGSPMTYMLNGQQYIVVAVSGPNYSGELIAYRLPPAN
jgi:quinoprotein glucose dehydrogenase